MAGATGFPRGGTPEECRAELERVADLAPEADLDAPPPAEPRDEPEPPPIGPAWPDPPEAPAFDGLAGEIIRAIEPHTEADPVAILVQLLIGFGNLIGRSAYFAVEADRHHANEFAALVGDTAKGRKGTSWGHARRLLEATDPTWTADRVMTGLSTGEGLIHAVRDPVTQARADPGRQGEADHRVSGQSRLTRASRTSESCASSPSWAGRSAWRPATAIACRPSCGRHWDSGNLRTLTRNNPLRATGAHVSIIGHITRDELSALLTRTDAANGFANRFLWLAVRRSKLLPFGGDLESVDFAPMLRRLGDAADFARTARPDGSGRRSR